MPQRPLRGSVLASLDGGELFGMTRYFICRWGREGVEEVLSLSGREGKKEGKKEIRKEGVENGFERSKDRGGGTAEWVDYCRERMRWE